MENRYLYRGKKKGNGNWVEWNALAGIPHNTSILNNTICQCTGYEGIYEKDIFRYEDENYIVIWSDDSLKWEAVSLYTNVSESLAEFYPDYMVAIGNAIDNSELCVIIRLHTIWRRVWNSWKNFMERWNCLDVAQCWQT